MKKLFVLFVAVAMVAVFTLPATAAEEGAVWNFYGSARISTWYEGVGTGDDDASLDTDNFNLSLQGNSRIGANVKAGAVSGRFEYGTGVNTRLLYGVWDFGGGEFLVGQGYTPIDMFYSNQYWGSDNGLLNVGGVYTGRKPHLQLKMAGFKVSLQNAITADLGGDEFPGEEHPLPKIEMSYGFNAGPAALKAVFGAQTFTIAPDTLDEDVGSWVAALGAKFNLGMAALSGNIFYGTNVGNYGLFHAGADDAVLVGNSIEDTDSWGGILVASFKASDMVGVEAGFGYTVNENSTYVEDDDTMCFYGNVPLTLAPGVYINPEIGYFDYGDGPAGGDEGDMVYAGAQFKINF